jgi:hypothetical protein
MDLLFPCKSQSGDNASTRINQRSIQLGIPALGSNITLANGRPEVIG